MSSKRTSSISIILEYGSHRCPRLRSPGTATGRQVSAVRPGSGSGSSRHRNGLSIAQIRSGEDLLEPWQRIRRAFRRRSTRNRFQQTHLLPPPCLLLGPLLVQTSLLSPTPSNVATEKKSSRYTPTVMVEPFIRTIKNWKRKMPGRRPPRPPSPL